MKNKFIYLVIIQLFFISTFAQSKCYLMGLKTSKKEYFIYQSLILNEDNTFVSSILFDMRYSICGIYEINNDILELKEFKINTDSLYIHYCEEPDAIKNILISNFETITYKKYKIQKNKLLLLNEKGRIKRRIKDNFVGTNPFANLFGKKYIFHQLGCEEVKKINQ